MPAPAPSAPRAPLSRGRRVTLALALLATLAGALELAARLAWADEELAPGGLGRVFVDHPTLLWHKRPNATLTLGDTTFTTNAWGMRGPPVGAKRAGVPRVLLLGESSTEGASVRDDETYAHLLSVRLGVEVLNGGTSGWSVWQSATMLQEWGDALAPDLVVAYHQFNDFLPSGVVDPGNYLYAVSATDRVMTERRAAVRPIVEVLLRSRAWKALRYGVLFVAPGLPRATPGARFGERVPLEDRREAWRRIGAWCRDHGARLVAIRPISGVFLPQDPVFPELARAHLVVDVPRWLLARGRRPERLLFDAVHPTAEGHALLAEAVAEAIAAQPGGTVGEGAARGRGGE